MVPVLDPDPKPLYYHVKTRTSIKIKLWINAFYLKIPKKIRGLREQKGEGAVVPFLNSWKI